MGSYQVLKSIHKVGHPLIGKVIGYEKPVNCNDRLIGGLVILETNSIYKVILSYESLFEERKTFDVTLLPELGCQIETVIKNHVDDTLYVSSRPSDLAEQEIEEYRDFYDFVEKNNEGQNVEGIVKKVMPFGLFVDIGSKFIGLIDYGHSSFNQGKRLPYDDSKWPREGELIKCIIAYYRFSNRQIGLGWTPE